MDSHSNTVKPAISADLYTFLYIAIIMFQILVAWAISAPTDLL